MTLVNGIGHRPTSAASAAWQRPTRELRLERGFCEIDEFLKDRVAEKFLHGWSRDAQVSLQFFQVESQRAKTENTQNGTKASKHKTKAQSQQQKRRRRLYVVLAKGEI